MEEWTYMVRHRCLLVPFLHVQFLIMVMYIYSLALSDMDTVKTIPQILGKWSIHNMFTLSEFNSISYQAHDSRIRLQPFKILLFLSNPCLVVWRRDRHWFLGSTVNRRIYTGFRGTDLQLFNKELQKARLQCCLHVIGPNMVITTIQLGKMQSFRRGIPSINAKRAHNL